MKPFRTLKRGMRGADVWACKRGVGRYLGAGRLKALASNTVLVRTYFGAQLQADVKKIQGIEGIPATGVIGPATFGVIYDHFDDVAAELYKGYVKENTAPPKPKLVKPNQGWDSLSRALWEAYSIGRNLGMRDLGTYNPYSRLPSGRRSDHAMYPAVAFDLSVYPSVGWRHATARKYAEAMTKRPEVEYVILSPYIWSRGRGWHSYPYGGHYNHVHVSGHR